MASNKEIKNGLTGKITVNDSDERVKLNVELEDAMICRGCGKTNPSDALFCFECGKSFSEPKIEYEPIKLPESLGYVVCNLCYGIYELEEGESPEDFDKCQCGGNLAHIHNLDELDDFKKKCSMCGMLNSFNSEKCYNCGKYFHQIPGYFESLQMDIEISDNSIKFYYKIFNKKDMKTGSIKEGLDHVEEYERSKITDLSLIMQRKGPYLKFKYEKKIINLKVSFNQAKNIQKFLKIPQNYAICPDENCSYDLNLNHGENCPECNKTSQTVPKKVYDKFVDKKKTKTLELAKKKENKKKKEKKIIQSIGPGKVTNINIGLKQIQFQNEAKQADILYKSYITGGLSRLDKINGRFLAMQTLKLDVLIEQNNNIIELLQIIAHKIEQNNNSTLSPLICPKCGSENLPEAQKCLKCDTNMIKRS